MIFFKSLTHQVNVTIKSQEKIHKFIKRFKSLNNKFRKKNIKK